MEWNGNSFLVMENQDISMRAFEQAIKMLGDVLGGKSTRQLP